MQLYYYLEANGLLDLPNEEAASFAAAATAKDASAADVRTYFREQQLWYWSDPQSMAGAIQAAISGGQLPTELEVALGELWSSLFGQSATVLLTATNLDISKRIHEGITALVALQVISEIQKNAFYDLAGGLLFANTTAADVQQAKDNKAEQDAAEQAENQRLENEIALRDKWSEALANTNADDAFYNGDEAALVVAINAAVATME
jgi:hypothetical protein